MAGREGYAQSHVFARKMAHSVAGSLGGGPASRAPHSRARAEAAQVITNRDDTGVAGSLVR